MINFFRPPDLRKFRFRIKTWVGNFYLTLGLITGAGQCDIWCLNRRKDNEFPCSFATNNNLLMIDGGHLSVNGAKIFGRNMISHPALKGIL
jgi:hypothetical protein